jgi:hypothetical protein
MNDRAVRRYEMFKRVDVFGNENAADFSQGSEALKRFGNIKQTIKGLDAAKAGQKNPGTTTVAVLLDALRLDVQNLARTADAIDQDTPGFAGKFPYPPTSNDGDLITTTDKMLAQLVIGDTDSAAVKAAKTALAARFIAHELDPDFVQNLQDDRAAIDEAQSELESHREDGVQNTAAIDRLIREGVKDVRYLNAIMFNKYTRNPDKFRAWQSASHIERAPQKEKAPAPSPAPVK